MGGRRDVATFPITYQDQEDPMFKNTPDANETSKDDRLESPRPQNPEPHKEVDIGEQAGCTPGTDDENAQSG